MVRFSSIIIIVISIIFCIIHDHAYAGNYDLHGWYYMSFKYYVKCISLKLICVPAMIINHNYKLCARLCKN